MMKVVLDYLNVCVSNSILVCALSAKGIQLKCEFIGLHNTQTNEYSRSKVACQSCIEAFIFLLFRSLRYCLLLELFHLMHVSVPFSKQVFTYKFQKFLVDQLQYHTRKIYHNAGRQRIPIQLSFWAVSWKSFQLCLYGELVSLH